MKRKDFLQSVLGASVFLGLPFKTLNAEKNSIQDLINNTKKNTTGNMMGFKTNKIKKVRVGIIGLGNRGNTLLEMFKYLVQKNHAEIIALSDISLKKVESASKKLSLHGMAFQTI